MGSAEPRAASATSVLTVEQLSVRIGSHLAIDGVSFEARPGELTAIIGPNGAGKTSLLEALVGLRPAEAGSVRLGDAPLASFTECARSFAYLPDQTELPPETSVRTLLAHALRCAAKPTDAAQLRQLLGIEPLLGKGAGVLSRGERQRLQLFSTFVLSRPVVVLDEPFSAFDPLQLRDVYRAVQLVKETGACVIASIHQLGDAEKMADRLLLLSGGRAVAFGSRAELRAEVGSNTASLEELFVELLHRRLGAA